MAGPFPHPPFQSVRVVSHQVSRHTLRDQLTGGQPIKMDVPAGVGRRRPRVSVDTTTAPTSDYVNTQSTPHPLNYLPTTEISPGYRRPSSTTSPPLLELLGTSGLYEPTQCWLANHPAIWLRELKPNFVKMC